MTRRELKPPRIKMVRRVTRKHGEAFADALYEAGGITEACSDTGVMTWPESDRAAQGHYLDLEDDICERTFEAVRSAISAAFVKVATDVLAAERRRR